MKIYFTGMMFSGKSTISKIISEKYNLKFFDVDKIIEDNTKLSINEIFSYYGEPYFRKLETNVLKSLYQIKDGVIALGGGSVIKPLNLKYINGLIIYLDVSLEEIIKRSLNYTNRPLKDKLEDIYNERKDIYEKVSQYKIYNNDLDKTLKEVERIIYEEKNTNT